MPPPLLRLDPDPSTVTVPIPPTLAPIWAMPLPPSTVAPLEIANDPVPAPPTARLRLLVQIEPTLSTVTWPTLPATAPITPIVSVTLPALEIVSAPFPASPMPRKLLVQVEPVPLT